VIIHRLQNRMSPTSSLANLSIFYTTAVFIRPVHGSNVTVSLEKQDDMGLGVSHVNSDQLHFSRVKGGRCSNHTGRESLQVAVDKPRAGAFEALFGSNRFYPKRYLSPAVSSTPREARPNATTALRIPCGPIPAGSPFRRPCILLVFRVSCGSST
jgi:hypothetical protein